MDCPCHFPTRCPFEGASAWSVGRPAALPCVTVAYPRIDRRLERARRDATACGSLRTGIQRVERRRGSRNRNRNQVTNNWDCSLPC